MHYREMREVFRFLNTRQERFSVVAAITDEANHWTVTVADEWGASYRLASFAEFEQRFPYLMLRTERPVYWGSDSAAMSWWQVLLSLGQIEQRYPDVRAQGTLQNSLGRFELSVVKQLPAVDRGRRSGVFLLDTYADVERVLHA